MTLFNFLVFGQEQFLFTQHTTLARRVGISMIVQSGNMSIRPLTFQVVSSWSLSALCASLWAPRHVISGMRISDCLLCMNPLFFRLVLSARGIHTIDQSKHPCPTMLCHGAACFTWCNFTTACLLQIRCNHNTMLPHAFMTAKVDHVHDTSFLCNKPVTAQSLFVICKPFMSTFVWISSKPKSSSKPQQTGNSFFGCFCCYCLVNLHQHVFEMITLAYNVLLFDLVPEHFFGKLFWISSVSHVSQSNSCYFFRFHQSRTTFSAPLFW